MMRPVQYLVSDMALEIRADGDLPPGVAGRVSGVALTYDVVDSYATIFARGCAKQSIAMKVKARKVPLLMDHSRTVGAHVGVVASMVDAGDSLVMTADLFDTPDGRAALEYVKTVIAAGASTGFSIGFVPRRSDMVPVDGRPVERFLEIELREVSLTPMPAVPGADVTGARTEEETSRSDVELLTTAALIALEALPSEARMSVVSRFLTQPDKVPTIATASRTTHGTASVTFAVAPDATHSTTSAVSMEARTIAVRQSFTSGR